MDNQGKVCIQKEKDNTLTKGRSEIHLTTAAIWDFSGEEPYKSTTATPIKQRHRQKKHLPQTQCKNSLSHSWVECQTHYGASMPQSLIETYLTDHILQKYGKRAECLQHTEKTITRAALLNSLAAPHTH